MIDRLCRVLILIACLLTPAAAQDLSIDDLAERIDQSRQQVTNPNAAPQDRAAAARARIDALRQLVLNFPDAENHPTNLADWAEAELYENLGALQSLAIPAHEFGVTSPAQRQALADAIPLIIQQIEAFDYDNETVEAPLRWRLLLSLATAGHAAGFLPGVPANQHRSDALAALDQIIEELQNRPTPPPVTILQARIQLGLGHPQAALDRLADILQADPYPDDGPHRLALLTAAQALRQLDDPASSQTIRRLERRLNRPEDAAWRLLVADWHVAPLRQTGSTLDILDRYRPLTAGGPGVEWIRATLAERWLNQFADDTTETLAQLPLWLRSQILEAAWSRLPVHPVEALAFAPTSVLTPDQLDRVGWVARIAQTLAEDPSLLSAPRAEAARIQTLATFAASQRTAEDAITAADELLALADQNNRSPLAVTASLNAADLLWPHQNTFLTDADNPMPLRLATSLQTVLDRNPILLTDTPNHILMAAHHFDRASTPPDEIAAFYRSVPLEASGYWQAQPLLLLALRKGAIESGDPPVRRRFRQQLQVELARIDAEAPRQMQNPDVTAAQRDGARTALFRVRLIRAQLAADQSDYPVAERWLDQALDTDARPGARLETAVLRTRFLLNQNRFTDTADQLDSLPPDAEPVRRLAIDLLSAIEERLTPVAALELDPPELVAPPPPADPQLLAFARRVAARSTANIDPEEAEPTARAERYAAQLLLACVHLLENNPRAAAETAESLIDADFATPEAIELAQVARIRVGDHASLSAAALLADRIIQGYDAPPFPPRWWRSWLRRLLVLERLQLGVAQIAPQVRRLERINPNLGGPELRPRFRDLADRALNPAQPTTPPDGLQSSQ
ncbi:hypothetical protein [Mucisphaera sp.]|uniref:hypothetical protein n=1 Tax=Mucisphaera sp. TaxID=2913024 RepID=UPI003D0D2D86